MMFTRCSILSLIFSAASLGVLTAQVPNVERPSAADDSPLFPCPDCGGKVSRRAVMCPKCGCPGSAIQEAVRLDEERRRPKRLAAVQTDACKSQAVLVRDGDAQYVLMDLFLLTGTSSLNITEMGTNTTIDYSQPELTPGAPLLRFKVSGQPRVQFVPIAATPAGDAPVSFLTPSDQLLHSPQPADRVVASLDETGAVTAVRAAGALTPVHSGMAWVEIKPAELRAQVDLLARARASAKQGALPPSDLAALTKTVWLTKYLKDQSTALLQTTQKPPEP